MNRLALAALALAACSSHAAPAAQPIGNAAFEETPDAPLPHVTDGALWTCRLSDAYPPQPCRFRRDDRGWTLRKLLGTDRFRGRVTFADDAVHFVGEYFCAWAECRAPMDVTFRRDRGMASYTAIHDDNFVHLEWDEALAAEWGGAGYGALTGDEP